MPQKNKDFMMVSSKTQGYHIRDIIYNFYEDNILYNNKEIKFISVTDPSFIKDTSNFGRWMELIDAAVNPYHVTTLKKQLDKAEIKLFIVILVSSAS